MEASFAAFALNSALKKPLEEAKNIAENQIKDWEKKNQLFEERATKLHQEIKVAVENCKTGLLKTHEDDTYKPEDQVAPN